MQWGTGREVVLFGPVWSPLSFDSSSISLMQFLCFPLFEIGTAQMRSTTDGTAEGSTNVQECKWKTDMS